MAYGKMMDDRKKAALGRAIGKAPEAPKKNPLMDLMEAEAPEGEVPEMAPEAPELEGPSLDDAFAVLKDHLEDKDLSEKVRAAVANLLSVLESEKGKEEEPEA